MVQVVREHYLRDDIWSGSPLDHESDPSANKLSADASHYIVVDTNVALQQVYLLLLPLILKFIERLHKQLPSLPVTTSRLSLLLLADGLPGALSH